MYFWIDESGHTGQNLFDHTQPTFFYGILSSPYDLNEVAYDEIAKARNLLVMDRLHGRELTIDKIDLIIDSFIEIHEKYKIQCSVCSINKMDYVVMQFFDQVFDSGNNQASTHGIYFTTHRYWYLYAINILFGSDNGLREKAWNARIELNTDKSCKMLSECCEALQNRVETADIPKEMKSFTYNILNYAKKYPKKIRYNAKTQQQAQNISTNLIGFQDVLLQIIRISTEKQLPVSQIVVDEQLEFNNLQDELMKYYQGTTHINLAEIYSNLAPPNRTANFNQTPDIDVLFKGKNDQDIGLEIVDLYLWILRRYITQKNLSEKIKEFIENFNEDFIHSHMSVYEALRSRVLLDT